MKEKSADRSRQSDKFMIAAREAGADVDTAAADALMKRLAKTPPEPKPAKMQSDAPAEKASGTSD